MSARTFNDLLNHRIAGGMYLDDIPEREIVSLIQRELVKAGYTLRVDGFVGPETRRVWAQFKKDNWLGQLEMVGLSSLLILQQKAKQNSKQSQFRYALTPQRQVFLALIRWAEGTDRNLRSRTAEGYNLHFGFSTFSDFSNHPKKRINAGGYISSAAGAYQIMDFSWDEIVRAYPLPDFSPQSQDQACLWLIDVKRKSLGHVDNMQLESFLKKCSYEWASFPFSLYGQPVKTLSQTKEAFNILRQTWNC